MEEALLNTLYDQGSSKKTQKTNQTMAKEIEELQCRHKDRRPCFGLSYDLSLYLARRAPSTSLGFPAVSTYCCYLCFKI